MQTLPQIASPDLSSMNDRALQSRRVADVVYQIVTVGAILWVLGSVWVF